MKRYTSRLALDIEQNVNIGTNLFILYGFHYQGPKSFHFGNIFSYLHHISWYFFYNYI